MCNRYHYVFILADRPSLLYSPFHLLLSPHISMDNFPPASSLLLYYLSSLAKKISFIRIAYGSVGEKVL